MAVFNNVDLTKVYKSYQCPRSAVFTYLSVECSGRLLKFKRKKKSGQMYRNNNNTKYTVTD